MRELVPVSLTVNGEALERLVSPRAILGDFLRQDLGLTGTHLGCEMGVCGACLVLLNDEPLGAALFEECLYNENGQLTNGSLAEYLVPMAGEMPDIRIGHVETPMRDTELGAKGCGEAGTAAASAAALNAVNDAIAPFGAAIAQIPMTPARVLRALRRI